MANTAQRNAVNVRVHAGLDQAAADGLLDLRRVGNERLAFHPVGAAAVKRVAGFFGVVQSEEALIFVVGYVIGIWQL